jgi:hypothetical protein
MTRSFPVFVLLLATACALPPEKVAIPPLPENGGGVPFADLLQRARLQAGAANDAFYVDRWAELENAAKGLEQAARLLPRSTEVPPRRKDDLDQLAAGLAKDAAALREAAKAKEVSRSNELLQRINLAVRDLRPKME